MIHTEVSIPLVFTYFNCKKRLHPVDTILPHSAVYCPGIGLLKVLIMVIMVIMVMVKTLGSPPVLDDKFEGALQKHFLNLCY